MTNLKVEQTLMYQEAQEAPQRVAQQFAANKTILDELTQKLRARAPSMVITCARGSSDHAATYAKYFIETSLGIPTSSASPSVSSIFETQQNMENVLFLAISQSGQSPDILTSAKLAKAGGAFVVCIVNDVNSPLAKISDTILPLHAGPEKSVASTKTFICTLSAIASLVASWKQDDAMQKQLGQLPSLLKQAFDKDWSLGLGALESANNLFVVSRGFGLSVAQEAALKFKETCGLHAEAYSAAEIKHGPMAIVKEGFPVLIFSVQDETQESVDDVALSFAQRDAKILSAGKNYEGTCNLDTQSCAMPELRPILLIQSFYKYVNALSCSRGFNPDKPPYLNKVTETL